MNKLRKHLCMESLLQIVRESFNKIKQPTNGEISIQSCLMSALAIFNFKYPSLLQFDKEKATARLRKNLAQLYKVNHVPCDTYMRERLDVLEPMMLRCAYRKIFAKLQRGKILEAYTYFDGHYLLSIDGTGQYGSEKIHCDNCCEKHHKDGHISYYHQLLGAVIVHPDNKAVIPMAPEPIVKTDGNNKNDCERNAAKRLLPQIRREHPHLKLIVIEDSLASNGPHIKLIRSLNMKFILGVKPKDHAYLFDWVAHANCQELSETAIDGTIRHYKFLNNVALNDTHHDLLVNFLEYTEIPKKGKIKHFSWVTDIFLTIENVCQIMKGGRARWKIENETFNTLKNQGYNFERNYGHGNKNLCSIFSMLMMLAFLIDEAQKLCCSFFKRARSRAYTNKQLWTEMLLLCKYFIFDSWQSLYVAIANAGHEQILNSS